MQLFKFTLAACTLCLPFSSHAQLSPPGLGATQTAFWSALGVRQKLDANNTSLTYFGLGRISDPDGDDNPLKKQSIIVLNEELYHKINKNWAYSYALSYRRQNEYASERPYQPETPLTQQEFRTYGRVSYASMIGRLKWKNTIRQEIRKFFTPGFNDSENGLQLRTRLKSQLTVPVGADTQNSVIVSAEALFNISNDPETGWGKFGYKESRFCLYYSYKPNMLPVTIDLGYMNNLIGYGTALKDASYIALDIVLENPF
jgi:Protein of unknown function (DUF2490)